MIPKQSDIDRELYVIKKWYVQHYPLCLYCGHLAINGDLSHIIRKSYSRQLQTNKLNVGLTHRSCHEIWDDKPKEAQFLPRATELLYIIYQLDKEYFNQIADNFPELAPAIEQFPSVPVRWLEHHGELLSLQYLNQ